ncbi:MAG TPA: methyltransferase domain-containing protein [Longimicrobium sp.]|nr:methyltransferase domain-containing protein [Longimicrobium sp.]
MTTVPAAAQGTAAVDGILARLAHLPPLHRAFADLVPWLCAREDWSVAVWGSVARGEADLYSDIDLAVLAGPDPEAARGEIVERMRGIGREIVAFSGSHVGRPELRVTYLEVDGWPVKIDLEVTRAEAAAPLPDEAMVLHAPRHPFPAARQASGAAAVDVAGLEQRFCGWIWYTYTKIARGELFQAARSIDFTRENALLPLLLMLRGLPQDGHRRIEQRLPPPLVQRLAETYPARLEPGEIRRALLRMADLYRETRPALEPFRGGHPPPDPDPLLRIAAGTDAPPGEGDEGDEVPPDWFLPFYGGDYLRLVEGLTTPERTEAEADWLVDALGLEAGAAVADVGCGTGRHSLALAGRGMAVTGLDASADFVARARAEAERTGTAATFVHGDMRAPEGGPYDAVLLLYQSFGFFSDEENELVLARWAARLTPGGRMVLDLWNRDRLTRNFRPQRTFTLGDGSRVEENSAFDPATGFLHREFVFRGDDGERRYPARFRLYAASELAAMLRHRGLRVERMFGSLTGGPFGMDAARMVIVVTRAAATLTNHHDETGRFG